MIIYKYLMNIKNKSQNNKKIFSAVFPNSINDESKYIETILETIDNDKFKFYKVFPKFTNFIKDLEDFVFYQEEPIISSGPYAQYSLMKKASKYVKVMLDGQGADETMAGYNPYYITYLNELIKNRKIFTFIKEAISSFDICINLFKFHFISLINKHKIKKINMMLNKEFLNKYSNYSHKIINNNLKLRLINDIFHQSLPAVLRYEDKNTMRFSIEGRLPFLSKDLVKYLFTLSNEAIIKNGWNKRILRDSLNDILPKKIVKRRKKIGFTTPETDWFINCKKTFYKIFLSKSFAMRPYWNRDNILRIYEEYLSGNNQISTMYFWRIINTELWLRKFIDIKKSKNSKDINNKMEYQPNKGKNIYITFTDHHKNSRLSVIKTYLRFPIKTKVFYQHTNLYNEILKYVNKFFINFNKKFIHIFQANPWYLFVSEKIVSITQGRSIPIWDIKVSYIARILSKYVHQSKFGIGIGSPWSMQLAIQESGVLRLIFSALIGRLLKIIGFKGVFYKLVGKNINSIDGPACYQVGTSIYSAKLPPENPHQIATNISNLLRKNIPIKYIKNFSGSVIIDANDIGSEILGQDTDLSDKDLKMIFSDNPQGQTSETTPISIVFQRK